MSCRRGVVGVGVQLSLVQGWVEKARKGVDKENRAMQEYSRRWRPVRCRSVAER